MDRILIVLKKENGPRACYELNFKQFGLILFLASFANHLVIM